MFSLSSCFSLLQKNFFSLKIRVDSFWSFLFYLFTFPIQKTFSKNSFLESLLYRFISSFLHLLSTCSICCLVSPCFHGSFTFSALFKFAFFLFFDGLFVFCIYHFLYNFLYPCTLLQNSFFFCFLLFPKYSVLSVSFFCWTSFYIYVPCFDLFCVLKNGFSCFFWTLLFGFLFHSS